MRIAAAVFLHPSSIPPHAPRPTLRRGHLKRRHEGEEHIMSMGETPTPGNDTPQGSWMWRGR